MLKGTFSFSTPLPSPTDLASVIASTVVVYAIEAAALIVLGKVMFHVHFPKQWLSLVLALLLGTLAFAALGIALAGHIRTGDGSSAVVNAIYLPLTYFIRLMRDVVLRNEDALGELGERRGRRRMGSRGSRPGRAQFSLGAEKGLSSGGGGAWV